MLSMTEPHKATSVDSTVALYRGLKVAVHEVDKTDLHLTRNDLIELVNVSCSNDSLFANNRKKLINYLTRGLCMYYRVNIKSIPLVTFVGSLYPVIKLLSKRCRISNLLLEGGLSHEQPSEAARHGCLNPLP